MKLDGTIHRIQLTDSLVDWDVFIDPAIEPNQYDECFESRYAARAYARGLAAASGCELDDLSTNLPRLQRWSLEQVMS